MSETTNLVPKRRFKEFQNTGAWEQRKLGEIYNFKYGKFNNNPSDGGIYPVFGANGIIGRYSNYNAENSVIIGHMGEYAGSVLWGEGKHFVTYNGTISTPKTDNIESKFGYYMLCRMNIGKTCGGSGLPFLSYEMLEKLIGVFPKNLSEQRKIIEVFNNLDNLIIVQQRKLEKTKSLKSAYLSEMFPTEGERAPKRRFAGFTGDWEMRRFGDIVERISTTSTTGGLPRVEYEDIVSGQGVLNKDIHQKASDKSGILFKNNDILYGKLRPYLKNWILAEFEGIAVGDFWVYRSSENDSKFIYSLIQSELYQAAVSMSTGTKMPRADWGVVSNTEFYIPLNIVEQKRIGAFFIYLDSLITLHQRKLEKLQNIKKAFLNEMFI